MLGIILLVLAFGCFALAAAWRELPGRDRVIAGGLALWVLADLVGRGLLHN